MIRVLVMIAVAGFLVSATTLSVAVCITGPEAIAHGAWTWGPGGWGAGWRGAGVSWSHDAGPQASRTIAWNGADALSINLPAKVEYTQAAGAPKLVVSGPQDAVDDVQVEGGRIRFGHDHNDDGRLTIVISAPSVTRFEMAGYGELAINDYRQDRLELEVPGAAAVTATGETKALELNIEGSGAADLSGMKAQSGKVDISGSGHASLAPTDAADVRISGSGDVTLLTHPAKLQTEISGSGRVRQASGEDVTRSDEDADDR